MRILYCNKYNYPFSGTEVYLFELMELMRTRGHEVALFSMADPRGEPTPYDRHFVPHIDFKAKSGWWGKAKRAAHAIYSADARQRIRAMIADFRPTPTHLPLLPQHLTHLVVAGGSFTTSELAHLNPDSFSAGVLSPSYPAKNKV